MFCFNKNKEKEKRRYYMSGIVKCMGIMSGLGFIGGAASSYFFHNKANKAVVKAAATRATQDGYIAIGGMTRDGKLWDGRMKLDEYQKSLQKKTVVASTINGLLAASGAALAACLTLLLKTKIK